LIAIGVAKLLANDFPQTRQDAGARFAERRASPRFPMVAEVEIVEPITQTRLAGQTSEISMGGCYVDVLNPLPPKTVIQICIRRESGSFTSWGRIAYIQEGMGMGVAFFRTLPEQETVLRGWIVEICR
jgi:hypothetical protein